jgi:hypothetical protein
VTTLGFLSRSEFWFQSLQNWQSEFLAVGTLVLLSVYLRQRASWPVLTARVHPGVEPADG